MTDFGTDTSCTDSLRSGQLVSGVLLVAQACYRRLITPRGQLYGGEDELNYGLDLAGVIGSVVTASAAAALPGQIENELLKDERIASVTATVAATVVGPSTTWSVSIDADTADGPFSLVLSVSGVTAQLIGVQTGT